MTVEETKNYLNTYRVNQAKIRRFSEEIALYPECATELRQKLNRAKRERETIEKEIENVEDPILRELLSQKYECGKTIEEIAYNLNYSYRHTARLHLKALREFKRIA
ncbi:MAG: hypothetical protein PUF48_05110 [Oscillospiraceae bacterium]|nr:hypothetical protein [Oscillospiraceae bacterium]